MSISAPLVRTIAILSLLLGACRPEAGQLTRAPAFGAGLGPPPSFAERQLGPRFPAPPPRDPVDVARVVARVRATIVSVVAGRAAGEGHLFSEHGGSAREHALGSGVLLTSDGLVLTSRHVIAGADDVRVELDDGRSFPGSVVARDRWLDVALIRLRGARALPSVVLGSSDAAKVGDPVLAIGNPFGLGPSVTRGILSAKGRSIDDGPSEIFLQTDAAINPGDSGGPLMDAEGRVIGINTAVLEHGQGVSFAVPIDDVRAVLSELLATGHVIRGHAGISYQVVDAAIARALSLGTASGAIVTELDAGGPAQRAGLAAGDVIISVDGREITRASDLAHELGRRKPGDLLRVEVMRDGRHRRFAVLLNRLPSHDSDEEHAASAQHAHKAASSLGLRTADTEGGARIEAVDPDTTAADDLRPGDVVVEVNRRAVKSAAELGQVLAGVKRPSTALLRVKREGSFLYVGLDLN